MADKTTLAESTQALFCCLAEFVQSKNGDLDPLFDKKQTTSFESFKKMWDMSYKTTIESIFKSHTDAPKVSYSVLEKFLDTPENNDWFISSISIAKKLIEDIDSVSRNFKGIKRPNPSSIWFVRGDKAVMTNIAELFKAANATEQSINKIDGAKKSVVFRDINKWSPADIYFASDFARKQIEKDLSEIHGNQKTSYTFMDLNVMISDLIDSGDLLPLSLKKTTKEVNLQKVNFDRPAELKEIKGYGFVKSSDFKIYKIEKPETRDLKIYLNHKNKDHIKFKHDSSTNAIKAEFQIAGAQARGGSVASLEGIVDLIELVDKPFGLEFKKIGEKARKKYSDEVKKLGTKPAKGTKEKEKFDEIRAQYSALYVSNEIIPPIQKWINKISQDKSDKFVRLLYAYITSRTEESPKFVIAK